MTDAPPPKRCAYCGLADHRADRHGPLVRRPDWDGKSDYPFQPPSRP